jgi:putative ABC transport system permease protein
VTDYATLVRDTSGGAAAAEDRQQDDLQQDDLQQDDLQQDDLQRRGRTFQVLGVDPFAEGPFRPYVNAGASGINLGAFMTTPSALLAKPTAEEIGVAVGDTLRLDIEGTPARLRVGGLLEPESERSRRALANLLVVDIATAQRLFDLEGRLSRVDLIVPDGAAEGAQLDRIRSALPDGARIQRSEARTETVEQMTSAFELNLTAMSLLALVVGAFLIYNTMTFSVVQRRALIGRLRALGVTRRQVFGLVLGEAVLVGLVGTGLGLLLGMVLASGLVRLITQTINDLYFVLTVRELTVAPWTLVKGAALGLVTTAGAALAPAWEATTAPVSTVLRRSTQESGLQERLGLLGWTGLAAAAIGAALLLVPGRSLVLSYAGLLGIIVAAACWAPPVVAILAQGLRPVLGRGFGVLGRMAARGVVSTLSRTSVAIAALMVAVAATVGVGVMIDSFRGTVVTWLRQSLQADVYVQPPSLVFRRATATIEPGVAERLRTADGVSGVYTVRRVDVQGRVPAPSQPDGAADSLETVPTELVAIEPGPQTPEVYRFKSGTPEAIWERFTQEDFVIISEPYAYRHRLGVGDTVRLQTDRGWRAFPVRGVFFDYASDLGVVTMSRSTYAQYYDDRGVSGIALNAAAGEDVDALMRRLRQRVAGQQDLLIRSNRGLREASLKVFDRTFTITVVLRLLAVGVAFIGVLTALMALALERGRELAVLRATGMTPGQLGGYVTLQTGVMGLLAGLLSLPLGYALAYVLIFVINKRSFGWTLQMEVAPAVLGQALLLAIGAALLAGLYPSWTMAQARPADALREE